MKCIIVDDEPIARRGMKRLAQRHPDIEICESIASAEEARAFLQSNSVDLIFLDIQMPGLSGLEFARELPPHTMVIFTTAFSEYALESYDVNAVDYLVKPIDPARFDRAIDKVREHLKLLSDVQGTSEDPVVASDFIIVKADRRYVRVRISEILFVEGLKGLYLLHLPGRRVVTRATLKAMEDLLPADKFTRINKSYIANIDAIDSFDSNDIFIGDTEIAIGQTFRDKIMSLLLPPSQR